MIRRKMGIEFPRIAPTQSFAVFEFKTDYAHENRARVVFGKEGTSVLWPLPGGYCRWGFEIDETAAEQYSRDKDRLYVQVGSQGYHALETDMLRRLLEERAPWFDGNIGNFRWRMIVRFEKRLAESFGHGRVWLAGDAGHLAAPIGMQSMNVGIREGCQLGETIAGVIGGQATSRKLEAYGLDRQREWRALMGLDSRMEPTDKTDPFLKEHADKLLGCLPAAMDALPAFAKTMGMVLSGDRED
jgi:2-polyprenyl-6-methoxyphenol hydroxylase-like FAD-dependent oxidoreductase